MDEKLKRQVIEGLSRYENSIKEIDEHYDELKLYGRYSPVAPYGSKHLLPFWIHLLEEEGIECEGFRAEYTRISWKLTALEEKWGRDYRDKLFAALKRDIDHYPTVICYFAYSVMSLELEIPNDLSFRSEIEILLMELERDFDLTEIKTMVASLDEVLKCIYMREIKEIVKIFDYYSKTEDRSYPDRFWWQHPLKILEEKQAMLTGS